MLMVVLLSSKIKLSQKVFDKFKVLTMMRFSHSYRCLKSVRIMLAIAAFYEIWQMDVKTAFLNGFIKEESILKVLTKCAVSSDPFMDWCKPLRVGIYALIVCSKHMVLYILLEKPVFRRK